MIANEKVGEMLQNLEETTVKNSDSPLALIRVQAVVTPDVTPLPSAIRSGTIYDGVTTVAGTRGVLAFTTTTVNSVTTKVGQLLDVMDTVPLTGTTAVAVPLNAMVVVEKGTVYGGAVYVRQASGALVRVTSAPVV